MADLPIEPLNHDQIVDAKIQELGRGVNLQARLLESIVVACNEIVKSYVALTTPKPVEVKDETPKEEKQEAK